MGSEIIQGSKEWYALKCGKIGASHIADIMGKNVSAGRRNYIAQLVSERLTGDIQETFQSAAMERGIEVEAEAREFYESETFNKVEQVAWVQHPKIEMAGASPDGLIGLDGGLEIKCPNTATHIDTLMGKPILSKYIYQIQWNIECTGRDWWHYFSYDNRLPHHLRGFIKRIDRDQILIDGITIEVLAVLNEVEEILNKLNGV